MRVAVIGAGWAGLAAAVKATQAGHAVTVFEASRTLGGRARAVAGTLPDGSPVVLDNGQHILIGAYRETLRMMVLVGAVASTRLCRMPLALRFFDGSGVQFPKWPSPFDALGGICGARGWSVLDKLSLLAAATGWQLRRFKCASSMTVSQLCASVRPRIMAELIEPLCVSALNTPAPRASGQVFLRVMKDALFGGTGSSNLLLPKQDLTALFPQAAADWLVDQGAEVRMGARVDTLQADEQQRAWLVNGEVFDRVIWATSTSNAALSLVKCAQAAPESIASQLRTWIHVAEEMRFEAITTVYAYAADTSLPIPMLTLRSQSDSVNPAQFVFDRGQLGGPAGLFAFVVSASEGEREALEAAVLLQARTQLGLTLAPIQTIVEKRATFACTPGLARPPTQVAPGLLACGDYCEGPYPATLEGAVLSGLAAAKAMGSA